MSSVRGREPDWDVVSWPTCPRRLVGDSRSGAGYLWHGVHMWVPHGCLVTSTLCVVVAYGDYHTLGWLAYNSHEERRGRALASSGARNLPT
jgi:hypothetical protein